MPISKVELRQLIQQANAEVDASKIMLATAQSVLESAITDEANAQARFQNASDAREALRKTLKALHNE